VESPNAACEMTGLATDTWRMLLLNIPQRCHRPLCRHFTGVCCRRHEWRRMRSEPAVRVCTRSRGFRGGKRLQLVRHES
jgi:hypothetical protein